MEQGSVRAQGPVSEIFSRLDLSLAQDQGAGTLIECTIVGHDNEGALTRVTFAGGHLWLGHLQRPLGATVRARIHARDVSLALDEPTSSTILNILPARIQELREIEQAQVLVKLTLGPDQATPLLARITRHSCARLGLQPGQPVFGAGEGGGLDGLSTISKPTRLRKTQNGCLSLSNNHTRLHFLILHDEDYNLEISWRRLQIRAPPAPTTGAYPASPDDV
ncbi:MAG: TOBE domain-containing protein [Chromatiales bacterium]|nr:TOBE domain-containing protein [Chromatiales bacterium]